MNFRFRPYKLLLKYPFTVAGYTRTFSPVVLVEIEFEGKIGYGEASMPPYLGESQQSVSHFFSQVNLSQFKDPLMIDKILDYVDSIAPDNTAAKAAIDIALHDLMGKIKFKPLYKIWNINPNSTPVTSFTIGIDKPDVIKRKTQEAKNYQVLKVKLGAGNDKEMIDSIRSISQVPIYVDINQGWKNKEIALEKIHWLKANGVVLIEQPLPKEMIEDVAWLTEKSPLPIIADESCQRLKDIPKLQGVYSGINIKLMKCTGLAEAKKMIELATSLEMPVLLGCMTETSCAISAASQLSPLVNWADLDGNLLITNDPFDGSKIENGKIKLNNLPGIGISKKIIL